MVLPDGRCDLIFRFNLDLDEAPTAIVTGPATTAYHVNYRAGDTWLGVRMRPENGVILWRDKIQTATDKVLRGDDALMLVPGLSALCRRDTSLEDMKAFLTTMSDMPAGQAASVCLTGVLDAIHASGGRLPVASLAVSADCSERHLNRLFRSKVGLSAKRYAQIVQFQRTVRLLQYERLPIAAAAFEGGYADHAHLTRSFRRFGNFVPSRLPDDLSISSFFG